MDLVYENHLIANLLLTACLYFPMCPTSRNSSNGPHHIPMSSIAGAKLRLQHITNTYSIWILFGLNFIPGRWMYIFMFVHKNATMCHWIWMNMSCIKFTESSGNLNNMLPHNVLHFVSVLWSRFPVDVDIK